MSPAAVPAPTQPLSPAERAALARAVLTRAERRTGTAAWVRRPPTPVPHVRADVAAVPSAPVALEVVEPEAVEPEAVTPSVVPASAADVRTRQLDPGSAARVLPVHPALTELLPGGALDRGATIVVDGSTSLVLALLAEASRAGSWAGFVGLPRVGVLAAHQLGLDLARLVLVPAPGPDGPTVVAALLDGVDVVVVGDVALSDADRRRLSARARERGAVLVSTSPWPGAHVALTAEVSRWEGLGRGEGRLRARRLTVRGSGRGAAARGWSTEVVVPPPAGAPAVPPAPPSADRPAREVPPGQVAAAPADRDDVVHGGWEGRRAG